MRGPLRPLVAGLVLLVALPAAQAALLADSLHYDAPSRLDGELDLLALGTDSLDHPATPSLEFTASSIRAVQYNSTNVVLSSSTGDQRYQDQAPQAQPYELGPGKARLAGSHGIYRLSLYAPRGMDLHAAGSSGTVVSQGPLYLTRAGLGPSPGTESLCADEQPTLPQFCAVRRDGPLLVHAGEGRSEATVTAPLVVLEMTGLDLAVNAQQRSLVLEDGRYADASPVAGSPVQHERDVFLRVVLTDARVQVALDGGAGYLTWAAEGLATQHDGVVAFASATGRLDDGGAVLDHERFLAPAGAAFTLAPDGQQVSAARAAVPVTPGSALLSTALPAPLLPIAAGAALLAAGLAALLRRRGPATLEAMEAALQAGEHRRAARVAAAVLRRTPGQEDARLGRAIALTRAGRPGRAAREVEEHLEGRDPSDGSLHYVLGLALLKKGRKKQGAAALQEAVRRTPELAADVHAQGLADALPPLPPLPALPRRSTEETSYV